MKLTEAEWTVMNALWEGAPATAREVLERIGKRKGWAYTTVKTLLDRLVDKDAVTVEKIDGTGRFTPVVSAEAARVDAVRSLVDRVFDGAMGGLIHHLAKEEKLTAKERARLRELMAESDREAERRPR